MIVNPLEEPGQLTGIIDPCIIVIFGATGDLTAKKLLPALYNLQKDAQLPSQFACVGFARRPKTHEQFREEAKQAVAKHSRTKPIDESLWNQFQERIFYHTAEFHEEQGFNSLRTFLNELDTHFGTKGNRVFYLSTQASYFTIICEMLHKAGLIYDIKKVSDKWSRLIIEKPFGHDLDSAVALQSELLKYTDEKQIFRIDHYLGKETTQNLLVFRFANSIFESLWNNRYIDHVQITVAEDIGIGTRGNFWEETGLLRDIVQNHVTQLLSIVAMEPPVNLDADSIRDEKVKVLQALRPLNGDDINTRVVRGQYDKGYINAQEVIGYRQEDKVSPTSVIESFVAIKMYIDNWRWQGVPFYVRSGKRLPKKITEIAIVFKDPPAVLFQDKNKKNEQNVLAIRIQPDEGISIKINCKIPGPGIPIQPVKMDFRYGSYFGMETPEAYERLICDCILGDSTLFAREDEVFNSWRFFTPILDAWAKNKPSNFPNYPAGSWGPLEADQMIAKDGRKWRLL